MILLDSNIVIYLRDPAWGEHIADKLGERRLSTCNVIVAEVLGYKDLKATDARYFADLFATMKNYPFNELVTKRVIELRKTYAIQLPDAIIAATALTSDLTLWTHNTADFAAITGLQQFDPLAS